MLNGIAPIFIFSFPFFKTAPNITGIPVLDDLIGLELPIPVYLDEKLTGVYVTSQEKAIDIESQPEVSSDGTTKVVQSAVGNTVSIHMIASKNSVLLSILLAFADQAFAKAVNSGYSVTYLNGSTLVFRGKIQSFTAQENDADDLVRISMVLHKQTQTTITQLAQAPLAAVAGTGSGPTGVAAQVSP